MVIAKLSDFSSTNSRRTKSTRPTSETIVVKQWRARHQKWNLANRHHGQAEQETQTSSRNSAATVLPLCGGKQRTHKPVENQLA